MPSEPSDNQETPDEGPPSQEQSPRARYASPTFRRLPVVGTRFQEGYGVDATLAVGS